MRISVIATCRLGLVSLHLYPDALISVLAAAERRCLLPDVRSGNRMPAESVMGAVYGVAVARSQQPGDRMLAPSTGANCFWLSLVCKAPPPDTVQRRQPIQHLAVRAAAPVRRFIASGALRRNNIGRHHWPASGFENDRVRGPASNRSSGQARPAFPS